MILNIDNCKLITNCDQFYCLQLFPSYDLCWLMRPLLEPLSTLRNILLPILVPLLAHCCLPAVPAQRHVGDSGQMWNLHQAKVCIDGWSCIWRAMFVANVRQINPNWSALPNNACDNGDGAGAAVTCCRQNAAKSTKSTASTVSTVGTTTIGTTIIIIIIISTPTNHLSNRMWWE